MGAMIVCPISGDISEVVTEEEHKEIRCPTCGRFRIANDALRANMWKRRELRAALAAALRRTKPGDTPTILSLPE